MKKRTTKRSDSAFSKNLYRLRKAKGLTQTQLAEMAGLTLRAISYYELEANYPPAPALLKLARALNVSMEELITVDRKATRKKPKDDLDPTILKKFRKLDQLPEKDQRAVIRLINSLGKTNK